MVARIVNLHPRRVNGAAPARLPSSAPMNPELHVTTSATEASHPTCRRRPPMGPSRALCRVVCVGGMANRLVRATRAPAACPAEMCAVLNALTDAIRLAITAENRWPRTKREPQTHLLCNGSASA